MPRTPKGEFTIQNFRFGLDTRRSVLTSQPGTLARLVDGHINQGAEIEKRKAFPKTLLAANVFGALATTTGILVFGSIDAPSLPSPFQYQQLTSPLGSAMTAVVGATLFNSQAFVVANFGTDGTFCYFNGVLVLDFTAGQVLTGLTTDADQANNLVALINATTNYTATIGATAETVVITGMNGANYSVSDTLTTAVSGAIAEQQVSTPSPGTMGVPPVASFTIQAGSLGSGAQKAGINYVEIIDIANSITPLTLTSGFVQWQGSTAATAVAVAENINGNTAANGGFTATSNGNIVSVYAPIGTTWNGFTLLVQQEQSTDHVGAVCLGNCSFNFFVPSTGSPTLTISSVVSTVQGTLISGSWALASYASLNALLTAIATAINTTGPDVAQAVGNTLFVSYGQDTGSTSLPADTITINYTASSGVTIGGTAGLTGTPSVPIVSGSGNNTATTSSVTVTPAGGTSPYKYKWTITNVSVNRNIPGFAVGALVVNSPTSASTSFSTPPYNGGGNPLQTTTAMATITATGVCVITDANGNIATVLVGISLTVTVNYTSLK